MKGGKEIFKKRMTLYDFDVIASLASTLKPSGNSAMLTAALDDWAILWKSKEASVPYKTLWATDSAYKDSVTMTYRDCVRKVSGNPQKAWGLTKT